MVAQLDDGLVGDWQGKGAGEMSEEDKYTEAAGAVSKRITIDGIDITEHVAAMYDALVGSGEWGSDFLGDEEIDALLIVGELAGFQAVTPSHGMLSKVEFPKPPKWSYESAIPGGAYWEWARRREEHWRAQQRAKIEARIAEMKGQV